MNGKDALTVVEADDAVDPRVIEQVPAKRRGSAVGHRPARKHEADSPAASRQLERALDEELISIDVRAGVDAVDSGFAHEVGQAPCLVPSSQTRRGIAAVAANHVPRRVSQNRVEPRVGARLAALVAEHLGKRDRPMEESMLRSRRRCPLEKRSGGASGQRRAAMQEKSTSSPNVPRSGGEPSVQNQPAHHRSRTRAHRPSGPSGDWSDASAFSFARTMAADSSG